ncbi:Cohesin domain-containing protein [Candidatus Methanophagaceae archaeon]|jgi:hypothetical protein|nr:Cohesin domain-containing protein [Methanophagales archaeon]
MTTKFFVALLATIFFVFVISLPTFVFAQAANEELPCADSFGVEAASGKSGTYVEIPVSILTVRNGPVQSIRFGVDYDEGVLNLMNSKGGVLTSKWTTMRLGKDKHTIILATENTGDAIPDGSSGSVVLLNFSVIGGGTSPMNMSFIELANSDGAVGRITPARNGTFTVTSTGGYVSTPTPTTSITPSPLATVTATAAPTMPSITPSPSATVTATAAPTTPSITPLAATPGETAAPTTPSSAATPAPTPAIAGFEAIFAITMLAISYLVLKKRTHKK